MSKRTSDILLSIARDIIVKTYGEPADRIFDYLVQKGYIAEETVTRDVEVKSNEARRILQRMSEEAIVTPGKMRVGNEVHHIWRLDYNALKYVVLSRLRKARDKLEQRLKYEQEEAVYECPTCGRRYSFDDAYANEFYCRVDQTPLVEANKDELIEAIKTTITLLDKLIEILEKE